MCCDRKTPYAGVDGMLPLMKGKLTLLSERSSRLSYSLGKSFTLPSILISECGSRYEADLTVVSFILRSQVLWSRCDV